MQVFLGLNCKCGVTKHKFFPITICQYHYPSVKNPARFLLIVDKNRIFEAITDKWGEIIVKETNASIFRYGWGVGRF